MCVCLPVLSVYMRSEMSHPSGAGVTGSNESPAVGGWEQNLGSVQEPVFLAISPHPMIFKSVLN